MRFFPPVLWLIMGAFSVVCLRGQEEAAREAKFTCGLNATYIFLNRAGHHVPYEKLAGEFQAESPPDSLLAVKNVLARHGCQTVGVEADADYFLDRKDPAIVYLQLNGYSLYGEHHFSYMVRASRSGGVEFLDPIFIAGKPSLMTWDTFTRLYKGRALVSHE